jgi:formylglycine-generating enzyme required for sulfatase activity
MGRVASSWRRVRTASVAGATLAALGAAFALAGAAAESPAAPSLGRKPVPEGMAIIPSGSFIPLYSPGIRKAGEAPAPVAVGAFLLDAKPVTNGQFLQFVGAHPAWQRSQAKRVFAEPGYLTHWAGDVALAAPDDGERPVTRVSWFAARAYCAAQGKTLPTTMQWEYAAAASATSADGESDPRFVQLILEWYTRPNPEVLPPVGHGFRNLWGVYDLHGLVWEWTLDFNTALVSGESRADSDLERNMYCGAAAATATSFRDYAAFMRYGYRSSLSANYTVANLGFRCAASA